MAATFFDGYFWANLPDKICLPRYAIQQLPPNHKAREKCRQCFLGLQGHDAGDVLNPRS